MQLAFEQQVIQEGEELGFEVGVALRVLQDQVEHILEVLFALFLLLEVKDLVLVGQAREIQVLELLAQYVVERLKVPVARALQVVQLVVDADLHFVLRVGQQAIAVVDHVEADFCDFERFELFLADYFRGIDWSGGQGWNDLICRLAHSRRRRLRAHRFADDFDLLVEADLLFVLRLVFLRFEQGFGLHGRRWFCCIALIASFLFEPVHQFLHFIGYIPNNLHQ